MADDDVQLTDLEVIQRYSLAVRGATASRAELVSALQSDLAWLQGGRRSAAKAPAKAGGSRADTSTKTSGTQTSASSKSSDSKSSPAKRPATKRPPAKRATSTRG